MANTLFTTDAVLNEIAYQFDNTDGLLMYANKQYRADFTGMRGDTIRIRLPTRLQAEDGPAATVQPWTQRVQPFTVAQSGVTLNSFTSQELTQDTDGLPMQYGTAAGKALCQKVSASLWDSALTTNHYVGDNTADINSFNAMNAARTKMFQYAMPMDMVYGTYSIKDYASAVGTFQPGFNNYGNSSTTRDANLPLPIVGQNINQDQLAPVHIAGLAKVDTPLVAVAPTAGSNVINITNVAPSTAGMFVRGDLVTFENVEGVNPLSYTSTGELYSFVVTADADSDAAGTVVLSVSPAFNDATLGSLQNITELPQAGAVVNVVGDHQVNLVYDECAVNIAVIPLYVPPQGAVYSRALNDPKTKSAFLMTQSYDPNDGSSIIRSENLYGALVFPEAAVRVISRAPGT